MPSIDRVAGVVPALGLADVEIGQPLLDRGLIKRRLWTCGESTEDASDVVGSRQGSSVDRVQASSDPTEVGLDFSGLGIVRRDAAGVIQPVEELGEESQLVAV